jgi:RNA-directed DNA polymerase
MWDSIRTKRGSFTLSLASSSWAYKIKRGKQLRLPASKIRSRAQSGALYANPKEKSSRRFMDQVRQRTKRRIPLRTCQLIEQLDPPTRGWGEYYKKAHVRKLFHGWTLG